MKNKYKIMDSEHGMGKVLILQDSWSDKYINIIKKENITALRLSESMGFIDSNISFLHELQDLNLRAIEIYSCMIGDISPLLSLPDLEHIGLECSLKKEFDLSFFKSLKVLGITWNKKMINLNKCHTLEYLNIDKYQYQDLQYLKDLINLHSLYVIGRKLINLAGIEYFYDLKSLDLYGCTNLVSLQNIQECNKLENIEIEFCNKIEDIKPIESLENLKRFYLVIKKINSINYLGKCSALEELTLYDTNVLDGEFEFLKKLPILRNIDFQKRKHYKY